MGEAFGQHVKTWLECTAGREDEQPWLKGAFFDRTSIVWKSGDGDGKPQLKNAEGVLVSVESGALTRGAQTLARWKTMGEIQNDATEGVVMYATIQPFNVCGQQDMKQCKFMMNYINFLRKGVDEQGIPFASPDVWTPPDKWGDLDPITGEGAAYTQVYQKIISMKQFVEDCLPNTDGVSIENFQATEQGVMELAFYVKTKKGVLVHAGYKTAGNFGYVDWSNAGGDFDKCNLCPDKEDCSDVPYGCPYEGGVYRKPEHDCLLPDRYGTRLVLLLPERLD